MRTSPRLVARGSRNPAGRGDALGAGRVRASGSAWAAVLAVLVGGAWACGAAPGADHSARAMDVARALLAQPELAVFDRVMAAGALQLGGSDEGDAVLSDAVGSPFELQRRAAASALLDSGDERILAIAAEPEADKLRNAVLQALRTSPRRDAIDLLRGAILAEDLGIQVSALDAAAIARVTALLPEIETLARTAAEPHVKQYAVFALAALGSEHAPEFVHELTESPLAGQREVGAACLGFLPGEAVRPALERLTRDPEPGIQIAAWASMSRLGFDGARAALIEHLRSGDSRRAPVAAGALKRIRSGDVVAIADEVVGKQQLYVLVEGRVIEAVGWARSSDAGSVLERALAPDADEVLRLQALWAIGWRGRSDERALAAAELDHPDPAIRATAAWALLYNLAGGAPAGAGFVVP